MEEKDIIETENKGNKGNPYHKPAGSPDGGQFTASPEAGGVEETSPSSKKSVASFKQFLAKKGVVKKEEVTEEKTDFDSEKASANSAEASLTEQIKTDLNEDKPYSELTPTEKKAVAISQSKKELINTAGISEEEVANLSDKECIKIANAIKLLQTEASTIDNAVAPYNKTPIIGVWKQPVYPSEYTEKEESGSIEKKKAFYLYDFKGTEEQKKEYLTAIDKFVEDGKKYNEVYNATKAQFAPAHKTADKFLSGSAYSQARKQSASIITADTDNEEIKLTEAKHLARAKKLQEYLLENDKEAIDGIVAYTGSYSSITHPLRDKNYPHKSDFPMQSKQKQSYFTQQVLAMDRGLVAGGGLDSDITVRRGVSKLTVQNIGGGGWDITGTTTQKELDALINTSFKDNSFVSCGGSSQTGFFNKVEMRIYCPKGIELAYIKPISKFANENEFLINRGYTYKITNAYKEGGKVVVECDCMLGTNADRYDAEQLDILASKHF